MWVTLELLKNLWRYVGVSWVPGRVPETRLPGRFLKNPVKAGYDRLPDLTRPGILFHEIA
jgi:hypothetical protein